MRGHCLYQPRHRVGQGAGIYFDPVDSKDIHDFLRDLGLMLGFNGQLGMDFILDEQGTWWLLEANPRATSGLHLLPDAARCFEARAPNMIMDSSRAPAMITLAMFIYAGRALGQSGFWRDFFNARDVVWNRRDPLPTLAQPLALLELWIAAHRHQTDLLSASTHDIAWNGEALPNLSDAWRD
jgi:hypothetical protein